MFNSFEYIVIRHNNVYSNVECYLGQNIINVIGKLRILAYGAARSGTASLIKLHSFVAEDKKRFSYILY